MLTLCLKIDPSHLDTECAQAALAQAAKILQDGGTVAFPTETVYGLGANALDARAVAKIFAAKQRPSWDPLIVHISDTVLLRKITKNLPDTAVRLMDRFWPGPLTLLLEKSSAVPDAVTAGRPRVGVRMPQHPIAHALLRAAGIPIAAPSANSFGRISPTTAEHVLEDLDGRIDAVLDGGETRHGLESTVIDLCETPCVIYRPGVISLDQIRAVGVDAIAFQERATESKAAPEALPSPGVGLRHYAPRAKLILIDGEGALQAADFHDAAQKAQRSGAKIGLMLPDTFTDKAFADAIIFRWGAWNNPEELAHRLFAGLRYLDQAGAEVILCPMPPVTSIGIAMRDRLRKAAK